MNCDGPKRKVLQGLKVLGFDCFNTIFKMDKLDPEEIRSYGRQTIDKAGPNWRPWEPPPGWYDLDAHDDVQFIQSIRAAGFICCTMSNGPVRLLNHLSRRNKIEWDLITPIELKRVYKRNAQAYMMLPEIFRCDPSEVGIVTANPTFGDVEAANRLGMRAIVIRAEGSPLKGLQDLAMERWA